MGSLRGRINHWGQLALSNPVAFVATFTLGAFLAFMYSYIPLHTVKDRKVSTLQQTMLQHEGTIASLEARLEGIESGSDEAAHEKAVASLESERDAANEDVRTIRADLKKVEKRAKQLERERGEWKRKVAALEKQIAEAADAQIATVDPAQASQDSGSTSPQQTPEPVAALAGTPAPTADAGVAPEQPESHVLPASPAP